MRTPRGLRALNAISNTNTYRVVVVAADEPHRRGLTEIWVTRKVTVTVTNVDETETVTLSLRQGQVNVRAVTATYNDLDNERPTGTNITWKWYLVGSEIPGARSARIPPATLRHTHQIGSGSHRAEASYTKTDGSKKKTVSATISVRETPSDW